MKPRFAFLSLLAVALMAQTVIYQDPTVKVLGDVAHGPPLAPITSPPENPAIQPPWGPRSYAAGGKCLNLSCRATVAAGDPVVVGFVVGQGQRIVMIRSVGPTLGSFGVPRVLAQPTLQVIDNTGATVARAVPWSTTSADTQGEFRKVARDVGAFPLNEGSDDAVLLLILKAGAYTVVVTGVNGSVGSVLVEIYDVPSLNAGL